MPFFFLGGGRKNHVQKSSMFQDKSSPQPRLTPSWVQPEQCLLFIFFCFLLLYMANTNIHKNVCLNHQDLQEFLQIYISSQTSLYFSVSFQNQSSSSFVGSL